MKQRNNEERSSAPKFLIGIIILLAVGAYIINFYDNNISKDPTNWGVLGDYIGGILNPAISLIALLYLMKTYETQKQELEETKIALEDTANYNKKISETQIAQRNISETAYDLQIKLAKIEIKYKKIGGIYNEINLALTCKYESARLKHGGLHEFHSVNGDVIDDFKSINRYIKTLQGKVLTIQNEIDELQSEMFINTGNVKN